MSATQSSCQRCPRFVSAFVEKVVTGNNCRECGRYCFDPEEASYLYLITHPQLKLHKVGIGTVGKDKDRLRQLITQGWVAYGIWHHHDARTTFNWEKKAFQLIKAKVQSDDPSVPEPMGKWVTTWSESISADAISVVEIEKIIIKIVKS